MFEELIATNNILDEYPYKPFQDPAKNLAERLVALGHLTYNSEVWAITPERRKRYWSAYSEHIQSSANTNSLSKWWSDMQEGIVGKPLTSEALLHEKNLILDPQNLTTPVNPQDILRVLRQDTDYLIDRARMWVKAKTALRKAPKTTPEDTEEGDN